jgi:mRNA interferase MazF
MRGDIHWVNLDPTVGSKTQKLRPCVVLNRVAGHFSVVIVVPLLKWQRYHERNPLFQPLLPSTANGLDVQRTGDPFQASAVDRHRLAGRQGSLSLPDTDAIAAALAVIVWA